MSSSTRWFVLMWLLVIAVSVNDGYWLLVNRPVMHGVEQNPLGRWLIHASGGDIWLLLTSKAVGTVCVASFLLVLFSVRPRIAWIACAALATLQLALLAYLYLA